MKLSLKDLSKSYEDAGSHLSVINSLSLELSAPRSVAIVGPSGVGKSTLLNLIGALEVPSSGEVVLDEINYSLLTQDELSRLRGEKIGFIFQFHHLLPEFSAVENVAMPLIIHGHSIESANDRAADVLGRLDLQERLSHRPAELSGGEQQRVSIARAVVTRPGLILADEPTGNLDKATAESVRELLIGVQQELNSLLIVVTHNDELARRLDVVYEMLPGGNLVER